MKTCRVPKIKRGFTLPRALSDQLDTEAQRLAFGNRSAVVSVALQQFFEQMKPEDQSIYLTSK